MAADPADLITLARAQQAFQGAVGAVDLALGANELTTLQLILTACSKNATRYCNRDFLQTTYDEIYPSYRYPILLKHWPIISLAFLRDSPTPVMTIQQTNPTTNQYATCEILSTGLRLKRIASGVTTTLTAGLEFAGNITITALVAAVVAAAAGWTAAVISPYGAFPSIDLWVASQNLQPFNIRDAAAQLELHVTNYTQLAPHPSTGRLQLPDRPDDLPTTYPVTSLRVQYSAGYATIPEDLQTAIASWTASIMWQLKRDPAAGNIFTATGGSSYRPLDAQMPEATRNILQLYKARNIISQ